MRKLRVEILILGSGFGGTLLSMMLAKRGRDVAIVDTASHPRFAIGESSTPLADQQLQQIASDFDLDFLHPLCCYGSWKDQYPHLTCGPKAGFSYFGHSFSTPRKFSPAFNNQPVEQPVEDRIRRATSVPQPQQMLVAASSQVRTADTHWLRADVDAFLCQHAANYAEILTDARYQLQTTQNGWAVSGSAAGEEFEISADFVVDATGRSSQLAQQIPSEDLTHCLNTNSGCQYAHYSGLVTNHELLDDTNKHPFCADQAAVHHVLADGWMWQLPFDDGTTSVGFCRRSDSARSLKDVIEDTEYLQVQFENATIVRPQAEPITISRIQYLRSIAAGKNWAALPAAVGFIDPLHSTGIAHTLFRICRLTEILTEDAVISPLRLQNYSSELVDEFYHLDDLISGCYTALPLFRLWCLWCMIYFAAITNAESASISSSFILSRDQQFRDTLKLAKQRLRDATTLQTPSAIDDFERWLKEAFLPWNHVGLFDVANQMYSSTVAPGR